MLPFTLLLVIPPLPILHADHRFLVLDKPSGLLSVPGLGPDNADCLAARVQAEYSTARIVHRLDQATSGVIVMALDAEAHRDLSMQFERRVVGKSYVAVVAGTLSENEGTIDLPMRKDMQRKSRHLIDHVQGKPAFTRWRVMERGELQHAGTGAPIATTRLELRPETGRSHQLRLHLMSIGHPIVGDDLYAPPEIAAAACRLLLHATVLAFEHPEDRRRVEFRSTPGF